MRQRRGTARDRWRRALPVALAVALLAAAPAAGQDFDREVAFLTIPTGARVVGMGRAATALPGEPQGARWNPAILATVRWVEPLLSHYDGPLDFRVDQFAVAVPAGAAGVVGLSVALQSFGDIPLFRAESPDVQTGEVSPSNLVLAATLAHDLATGLYVGLTGKWIRSELISELEGSTYALDAGVLWRPAAALPLHVGVGVLNVGRGLRVGDAGQAMRDPLPSRLRVGASFDVLSYLRPEGDLGLLVAGELEHALRDMATGSQYVGAELSLRQALFLRIGHIAETLIDTNVGWTLGAGLAVGPVRFDLARELGVNQLGDETHVSLRARL